MNVLVTSATSRTGRLAADALSAAHDVTRTDLPERLSGEEGVLACDLGHGGATDDLVRGMDAVVHPGFGAHTGSASWLIDFHTRRTYNLLRACVNQGVPHAVYLSTLRLMEGYEERLTVSERWKPLPSTGDEILAVHLGEYVFREYAREEPIAATVLRLGFPLLDGGREEAERSGDSAALAVDDMADALRAAVSAPATRYRVLHIQSPTANARYLMGAAEIAIGYPERRDSLAGEGAAR